MGSATELVQRQLGFRAPQIDEQLLSRILAALGPDTGPRSVEAAIVDLATIGETFFLRHRDQLDWIESTWLPARRRRLTADRQPLRVLFAACSTGEEVYSFLSRLLPVLGRASLEVVAVDVCSRALEVARRGRYGLWSLRGTSPEELKDWLTIRDGAALVSPSLLSVPTFAEHNLLQPLDPVVAPGSVDLIMCRNMLMYLHDDALRLTWESLARALAPSGTLLTSVTDPQSPTANGLTRTWTDSFPLYDHRPPGSMRTSTARDRQPDDRPARRPQTVRRPAEPRPERASAGPPDPDPMFERARIYAHAGQAPVARVLLDDVLSKHPFHVASLVLSSLLSADADEPDAAVEAARRAVYLAPDDPFPHYVFASALIRAGRRAQADRVLRGTRSLLDQLDAHTVLEYADGLVAGQLREVIDGA